MQKKIKVAITQRIDYVDSHKEYRDSLDNKLIKFINELDMLPFLIPNGIKKDLIYWLDFLMPDGIVFSGGNDIGQYLLRDQTETITYNWALKNSKPIFGICRGMQFLGQLNGVKLVKVDSHVAKEHSINCIDDLNTIKRKSFHKYAIENCPKDFRVTHTSTDGIIEGFEHNYLKIKGIMWHPERENNFDLYDLNIFKTFYE